MWCHQLRRLVPCSGKGLRPGLEEQHQVCKHRLPGPFLTLQLKSQAGLLPYVLLLDFS